MTKYGDAGAYDPREEYERVEALYLRAAISEGQCHECGFRDAERLESHIRDTWCDDPGENSAELRRLREGDLMGLLGHLDKLWGAGVLPQTVRSRR
ncbi:hypothetical protein [Amycolatopsis albispora]|uniref:hypothetical protein n=1 Tax=Amycolatopsis albispora TaxID=1804986 RepID=UPI0013B3E367|nr:hypothetical protein [Amycolatopsis albispora]